MAQTAFLFLLSARKSKEVRINKKHLEKWPSAENRYYYVCVSHITITTPPTTMTSTKEYAHGKFFDGLLLLMNDRTTCSYMDISPHHITSNQKIYIHTPMKLIPNSYRPNLYTFCWGRQVGINNRNHQSQQSRGLRTALRPPFLDTVAKQYDNLVRHLMTDIPPFLRRIMMNSDSGPKLGPLFKSCRRSRRSKIKRGKFVNGPDNKFQLSGMNLSQRIRTREYL